MQNELASAVSKLRTSSQSLNQITDNIAKAVQEVEDFLNKTCSAGVFAFVTVSAETDMAGMTEYLNLEYVRVGPRFRIAVAEGVDLIPEGRSLKAWAECTRSVKLETAVKIPELILEIAKKIDQRVEEAKKTSEAISAVVQSLKAEG